MSDKGTILEIERSQVAEPENNWNSPGCATAGETGFGITVDISRQGRKKKNLPTATPTRRLRGFVIAFDAQEARVHLKDGNETYEYFLPAQHLKKAGITEINQPFELDEFEEATDDGFSTTYKFRPMAAANDTVIDVLDDEDDEELKSLRDAARGYFKEDA